jgi:hypothetical protein
VLQQGPLRNHGHRQCLRVHETTKWRYSLHVTHDPHHFNHSHNPQASLFLLPFMRPQSRTSSSDGIEIHLKSAPKIADKAPKIPDPNYRPPTRTSVLAPPTFEGGSRRSPRFQRPSSTTPMLRLDVANLTPLGCKGWRGTLNNGHPVFAKLWNAWKLSSSGSEHEACLYDLWTTVVPDFLGFGQWGFFHILLLSDLDVCPFYSIPFVVS